MPFDGTGSETYEALEKVGAVIKLLDSPTKWCKGALRSYDGRYCIRGAIRVAEAELLEPLVLKVINETISPRFRRIESFNDHPNTTHDQIITVLNRTRDLLVDPQAPPAPSPGVWRSLFTRWFTAEA